MPRFDYECSACKSVIEVATSISSIKPSPPMCCGKEARRVYGNVNFSIRGYNSANGFDKCHDGWNEKVSI